MIKTRRRLLSGLLALIMVAGMFAAIPFTANAATVDYRSFFVNGISGGHNYDVVSGRTPADVTNNTIGRGVTWDAQEKCAVFDGAAYFVISNPLTNANASTGFTITMEAYISSANTNSGKYITYSGQERTKNGWQRLFDLSDGTINKYLYINAGSASHLRYAAATTGAPDRGGDEKGVSPSGLNYYNAWHTYSLVVQPGGNMYLYVDGIQKSSMTSNSTVVSVLNQLSTFNKCYIGTSIFEATGAAYDGFFIGKIRGLTTVNASSVYKLSYNTNGGAESYTSVATPMIPANLPTPTKANNVFGGWYTDSALTKPATSGTKLTANTTLYAKWLPRYTVTYKIVNGTWSNNSTANRTETVTSGSKPANVPTGMKASQSNTVGAWNANPTTATIWGNTTFTYTFKANPVVTGVTAKSLTYNTQSQQLVTQGSTTGGTLQYSLGGANYSTNLPTATNAGTYTVYYRVMGNSNYWDRAAQTVAVTIKKANPVVTGVTAKSLTYNTQSQQLVTQGSTTGGTLLYSLDGVNYSADVPTATNTGTYTVYYKVQGNSNYNDIAAQTVEVKFPLFTGHTISLNGYIDLNFYVNVTEDLVTDGDGVVINFTWDRGSASYKIKTTDYVAGRGYKATVSLPAAEMSYSIHATATIDGALQDETNDYSVREYALDLLENTSDQALITLVKTMLDYGAKAQVAFDRTDVVLANKDVDYTMPAATANDVQAAIENCAANSGKTSTVMKGTPGDEYGVRYYATSLVYLSGCSLRQYYTVADNGCFQYYSHLFNDSKAPYYYLEKPVIPAAELDELQEFVIGDSHSYYSALDFVKAVMEHYPDGDSNHELAEATYWYNQAANAFFD